MAIQSKAKAKKLPSQPVNDTNTIASNCVKTPLSMQLQIINIEILPNHVTNSADSSTTSQDDIDDSIYACSECGYVKFWNLRKDTKTLEYYLICKFLF